MKKFKYYALINFIVISHFYSIEADQSELSKLIMLKYSSFDPCKELRSSGRDERVIAFNKRLVTAQRQTLLQHPNDIESQNNGDENTVPFFAAQFTKTLEHDLNTGLLTEQGVENYKKLLIALESEKQDDFNLINRAPGAGVALVNPQAAFAFSLEGKDSSLFKIDLFPRLSSEQSAAELIEIYLQAIARDVEFKDYGTALLTDEDPNEPGTSITEKAARVLKALGHAYQGPRNSLGQVDITVLFRGKSAGDLIGPYISQFLLLPLKIIFPPNTGAANINSNLVNWLDQQRPVASAREFGVSFSDFVALQNGKVPKVYKMQDFNGKRYTITGRDISTFVHTDTPYETFYYATCILASRGFPLSKVLPYANGSIKNEVPFVTTGGFNIFSLLGSVTHEVFKAVWAQKWRAHRVLRPEAFAGLVHNAKVSGVNQFNLHSSLFNLLDGIDLLDLVLKHNQLQASIPFSDYTLTEASTYLMSLIYPEGSPAHPSYPSGHAGACGAQATILKAIFDDTILIKNILTLRNEKLVIPDPTNPTMLIELTGPVTDKMTVGSELDKLASNIAFGRNFAGIHYRADAENGILLGEEVAISFLQDYLCTCTEQGLHFFELTKRNGQRIRITANEVIPVS